MDSDVEVEGDQDNSYKDLASLQEDSGQPIDTKLAKNYAGRFTKGRVEKYADS